MVTVTCLNNLSDPRTVYKELAPVGSAGTVLSGTLKEETSILDPEILIEYDHVPEFNYIGIREFGNRYYFVNEVSCVRNNLYRLRCHVDVLFSWWSQIKGTTAVIGRIEEGYDKKMNDTLVPTRRSVDRIIVPSIHTSPFNELTRTPEEPFTEAFPYVLTVYSRGNNS